MGFVDFEVYQSVSSGQFTGVEFNDSVTHGDGANKLDDWLCRGAFGHPQNGQVFVARYRVDARSLRGGCKCSMVSAYKVNFDGLI